MFKSIPTHACDPALRGHTRGWECEEDVVHVGLVATQSCFRRGKPNGERDGNCWSDSAGSALFLLKGCSYNELRAFDLNLRSIKSRLRGSAAADQDNVLPIRPRWSIGFVECLIEVSTVERTGRLDVLSQERMFIWSQSFAIVFMDRDDVANFVLASSVLRRMNSRHMNALIELEEITKDYVTKKNRSFRALDNVSLQIPSGITGLLGPNGAGKSTLIKVLLGLVRLSGGRGRLLNYALGRQSRQIRANVGYMPEDDCYLHGMTGIESVQCVAQLSNFPAVEGLRRAHEILDFCGLAQERYRKVETYSTGMRQKLRFAQAIVHDPPVLILDEPTSGLDPEERQVMLNRIRLLSRDHGKTVLLCTHILPDVQSISDSVVILAKGRVQVADSLAVLSRPTTPSLQVRLLGPADQFLERVRQRGIKADVESNGKLVLQGLPEELSRITWQVASECDVGVRSMTPSRNSLEEIFVNAVRGESRDD